MRLASQSKEVNEVAVDQQENQQEAAPVNRLCVQCKLRAAERVTLYTKKGTAVHVENVMCALCAADEQEAVDVLGAGAAAGAGDEKEPLLVSVVSPVAADGAAAPGGAVVASAPSAAAVMGDGAGAGSTTNGGSGAANSGGSGNGNNEAKQRSGLGPFVSLGKENASPPPAVSPGMAMQPMGGVADMSRRFKSEIGLTVQLRAVILKEFAILAKQRKQNCCQVIILVVRYSVTALHPSLVIHAFSGGFRWLCCWARTWRLARAGRSSCATAVTCPTPTRRTA